MNLKAIQIQKLETGEQENVFSQLKSYSKYLPTTQTPPYLELHKEIGRQTYQIAVLDEDSGDLFAYIQLVKFPLPFGLSYLYAPYGPVLIKDNKESLDLITSEIRKISKQEKNIFSRLDITPIEYEGYLKNNKSFSKSPSATVKGSAIQPRAEWMIDLEKNEERLSQDLHKKTRYDLRQAEKSSVKVKVISKGALEFFETFYEVLKETSDRNNFHLHNKEYYKKVFEIIDSTEQGFISLGFVGGKIATIHVIMFYGKTAMYIFGGSRDEYRNIPSSHLVQWKSILKAKELGIKYYNMGGISTDKYPNKNLEPVTRFKKRFGGEECIHANMYDIVHKTLWYHIYIINKKISGVIKKFK